LFELADTHCHLDFAAFDPDREAVLERAGQAAIQRVLIPGIDLATSQTAIQLAQTHPGRVFAAVGIHPNDSQGWDDGALESLRHLARQPGVVAIGEIGLDYYRDKQPPERQRDLFVRQLGLAAEFNLPVIIHNRRATTDILSILAGWVSQLHQTNSPLAQRPGVVHSFGDDLETARQIIALNLLIGIGGPVTFQNAKNLQAVAALLPLECLVFETDAPFLAPHPHRGQRNEPAYIALIAEKMASLKQISMAQIASATSQNAARLFAWSKSFDSIIL
jgi:TatD DNase family protein